MNEATSYTGPKTPAEIADETFIKSLSDVMEKAHANADVHGFWDDAKMRVHRHRSAPDELRKIKIPAVTVGEATIRIAQIHGELSEALDALNHGNPPSTHIGADSLSEELADVIIRTLDLAAVVAPHLPSVILTKMKFNAGRPYQHGKTL